MPSIASRRAEILRLIARVRDNNSDDASDQRAERLSRHRKELAELKKRRQTLEADALWEQPGDPQPPQDAMRRLEARVAALEKQVQRGLAAAPAGEPPAHLADATLSGAIREGLLADLLQLVSSNLMTGVFTVEQDGSQVQMWYREGEIYHAEGGGLSGESAFFAAMAMETGWFSFREIEEPAPNQTINSQTQFLILEALRQIDEARAQQHE
jgi:hypothetical protein